MPAGGLCECFIFLFYCLARISPLGRFSQSPVYRHQNLLCCCFQGKDPSTVRLTFWWGQCEVLFIVECVETYCWQRPHLEGAHPRYHCGGIFEAWLSVWRLVLLLFHPVAGALQEPRQAPHGILFPYLGWYRQVPPWTSQQDPEKSYKTYRWRKPLFATCLSQCSSQRGLFISV